MGKDEHSLKISATRDIIEMIKLIVSDEHSYVISIMVYGVVTRLNNLGKLKNITFQEFQLAQKLQKTEVQKFNQGDSGFFVVNIIEQSLADAEVKNIKVDYYFVKTYADYLLLIFQMMK